MLSPDFNFLVEHMLRHHIDDIAKRSYLNCHAVGLHSLMLIDTPGKRVRLYYADNNHELWRNEPTRIHERGLAGGFHAHPCDLTIKVVHGNLLNWVIGELPESYIYQKRTLVLNRYLHESTFVQKGKMSFSLKSRNHHFITKRLATIGGGIAIRLSAKDLHTVAVAEGESAAWLVMEGVEDSEHDPYLYSNIDLAKVGSLTLYKKPTTNQVRQIIEHIFFKGELNARKTIHGC